VAKRKGPGLRVFLPPMKRLLVTSYIKICEVAFQLAQYTSAFLSVFDWRNAISVKKTEMARANISDALYFSPDGKPIQSGGASLSSASASARGTGREK